MKANNALIILWSGTQIPDELVYALEKKMASCGITTHDDITMLRMDESDIAEALLSSAITKDTAVETTTAEAIKSAVVYIGKRFEVSLASTNADLTSFTIELAQAVNAAKATGYEPELLNAIEILSTSTGEIPGKLVKQYHFTKQVIAIIKKVYKRIH